jgi:hypothetical protein
LALANTTLSSACAATDGSIVVASTTSLGPGMYAILGSAELIQISKGFVAGTAAAIPVPVMRGLDGTPQIAHPATANVSFFLLASDIPNPAPGTSCLLPSAGRALQRSSVTTTAAWLPQAGAQDEEVEINGTSVVALTLTNPTKDQNGKRVTFRGNGIAAHTLTYTTVGFGNVGATADVVTFGASQIQSFTFVASGGFWINLGPLATATANVSGPSIA